MDKYLQRGVSSEKNDVHNAIKNLDKGLFPNAFAKVLPDILGGDENFCNIIHADGAGTKSSLAYAYWRETGDLSVWEGIAQDAIVMNTDDLLCVGAVDNIVISSTIGRNKFLIPAEVISAIIQGTEKFISEMKKWGINIYSGGGETADIGDLVRTIVVDTTAVARMPKSQVIEIDIKPGDVIVGLASFGKALYEQEYNSGMGSNGLTSARHDIFGKDIARKYPETFDDKMPEDLVYTGKFSLTDEVPGHPGLTMGKFVLSPTRTYLPVMKEVFARFKKKIHGIIHNTGGGHTKVLKFVNNMHIVKDNLFDIPLIFKIIKEQSGIAWREMFKVFNMGNRLEIYTDEKTATEIVKISKDFDIDAKIIGHTEKYDGKKLTIKNNSGEFVF